MATIVNAKFKQKRGTEESMPTLLEGELYVCTDSKKLYVGTASGNQLICDISKLNDITKTYDDLLPIVPDEGFSLDTSNLNGYFKINGNIVKVWFSIKSNTIKEANTWVKITTLAFNAKLNTGGFAVASDNVNIKPFIYSGCAISENGELYVYGVSQWNSIKGYIEFLLK